MLVILNECNFVQATLVTQVIDSIGNVGSYATSLYDPNGDGATNVLDVQIGIRQALELSTDYPSADCNSDDEVNVLDVQLLIRRALGLSVNVSYTTISGTVKQLSPDGTSETSTTDALVEVYSFDNRGQIASAIVKTTNIGAFTTGIDMSNNGGYIIVNVMKDGFTDFNKRIDYTSPQDINLGAEIRPLNIVVSSPGQTIGASGKVIQAFKFGLVKFPDGTKRALSGSRFEAAKLLQGSITELEITIPAGSVNTDTLVAKLETFDSSNPEDAKNFPGDYMDSDGNKLVSLAFDYINITDDLGNPLGSSKVSKTQSPEEPTIIVRRIPSGSSESLLRDEDGNSANGFQVPIYTYNPVAGRWMLVGVGTVVQNDGVTIVPIENVKTLCAAGNAYARIEVTNQEFIDTNYWNLDYPILPGSPYRYVVKVIKDEDGNPISGVSVQLYDDDGNSFNCINGTTDGNGRVELVAILLDGSNDMTARISYYNPYTWSYENGEIVNISDSSPGEVVTNTIQRPGCQVEGKVVNESGTSQANESVQMYGRFPDYFYASGYTDTNGNFSVYIPCNQDIDVYVGSFQTTATTFNVNNSTLDYGAEASDNGTKVVLKDIIKLSNLPPWAWGYLSSFSVYEGESVIAYIWAGDYDGNYPLNYTITGNGTIFDSGTFSASEWYKERGINLPNAGTYNMVFTVTDFAGNGKSASIEFGTVEVSQAGVSINRSPVIMYAYATPSVVGPGENVSLIAQAYDLDGDLLSYTWQFGGETIATDSTATWTVPTSPGTYTITLIVSDNKGGSDTATVEVVVSAGELSSTDSLELGLQALGNDDILTARDLFRRALQGFGNEASNDADSARFFYALTRVASLWWDMDSDSDPYNGLNIMGDILDAFGLNLTGRDPENFDIDMLRPEILPSNSPTGQDLQAFLYNVVRPELEGAIANLDVVSQSFNRQWTEPIDYTTVESDSGDVLTYRSALKSTLGTMLIQYTYNLNVDIDDTDNSDRTIEQFLGNNPDFLTLARNTHLSSAKNYLSESTDDATAAIDWIQSETDDQTDDWITLVDWTAEEIEDFREGLRLAKDSLSAPTTYDNDTPGDTTDDTTVDMSPFFAGLNLREFLPTFVGDDAAGLLPDPTFGNTLIEIEGDTPSTLNEDRDGDGTADVFEQDLYYVYGGNDISGDTHSGKLNLGYDPEVYGFFFLGVSNSAEGSRDFTGAYSYYVIRYGAPYKIGWQSRYIDIDAFEFLGTGQYYGSLPSWTSNFWSWWQADGAPDGVPAYMDEGFALMRAPSGATGLRVYGLP